jgi:hypothetical protein
MLPEPWGTPRAAVGWLAAGTVLLAVAVALALGDETGGRWLAVGLAFVAWWNLVTNLRDVLRRRDAELEPPDPTFYDQDHEPPWRGHPRDIHPHGGRCGDCEPGPGEVISLTARRRQGHP